MFQKKLKIYLTPNDNSVKFTTMVNKVNFGSNFNANLKQNNLNKNNFNHTNSNTTNFNNQNSNLNNNLDDDVSAFLISIKGSLDNFLKKFGRGIL